MKQTPCQSPCRLPWKNCGQNPGGVEPHALCQNLRYVKMNPLSLQGLTPRLGTSLQLAFVYPDWLKERMSEACNVSFANHDVGVFVNLSVDRIVRNCPKAIRFLKLEAVLYPTICACLWENWRKTSVFPGQVRTPFMIQHGLEDRVTDPNTSSIDCKQNHMKKHQR